MADLEVVRIWIWQESRYLRDGWTINYWPRVVGNPFQWPLAWLHDIRPLAVRSRYADG